ncbi:MAG: urease accessory protein UreD [Hydrogenophilales bacterium]|nr:urease accessory protein UreD [Hydrogenophilales bacterium]
MDLAEPVTPAWHARLSLGFERRDASTILTRREHFGPLRVQKALYPEGGAICHTILLHPPSGIAGGDQLAIEVDVAPGAQALLTTPGAGKWYRSAGPLAAQNLHFRLAEAGTLEWLPQESIVFDGARAAMTSRVELTGSARFLGWEVLCLGRRASGERYATGGLSLNTRIERDGRPIWLERGRLDGGSTLLDSPAGLAGFSVSGTLLASGAAVDSDLLTACRAVAPGETGARTGLSALPDLLVARYLGHSSEAARHWFTQLWHVLRPAVAGRESVVPRIWNT